ncbi:glycosyltransferase [Dyadobacter chenwenxiniae]|uniref:Glycosyltransferase n=1 Tax=Dyadobacter chenwenxiniae TaxID=2906456 RepID=A0A9X1PGV1_9BACT|nr:glycosyltransferase [Dyadobacter chenwenxiniae]MCF0061102.1 glycosyltransferase [Dyadobacter chenwenxiniae]UON80929.1 glycosyltransferase [Dyadobacter chenwenxiniae]
MSLPASLAPIVLFCFNRPAHLQQTIEALQQNMLAAESELIIYSDGPRNSSDEPLIAKVRAYLSSISGFQRIKIIKSEANNGLAASVIKGVTEVLNQFGKVIVLEDDMLSAPDFLVFMNEALSAYESRKDIFSVTAYGPPISFPAHYKEDLYLAPRASSWGWGTWLSKWDKADWNVTAFSGLQNDKNKRNQFKAGGEDLWPMLVKQQRNVIDSWAIRWTYSQFINNAYGVYPVHSKIRNIGTDGSGTNFTFKTGYYGSEMSDNKIRIDPQIKPDQQIIQAFADYYKLPLALKIKNRIKYGV